MPLFDDSKPFEVHILSGGEKVANLRFPTDSELCERARRVKSTRKQLGRNRTEFEHSNLELVDSELFEKLRLEPEQERPAVDAAEASKFMGKLLRADVKEVERSGDTFEVEMKVCGGIPVKHTLRMPTQKDILNYGRQAVRMIDTRRAYEFRVALEPAGALWDQLQVRTEGYANGHVPITHKDVALTEVMNLMETEDEDPEA